MKKNELMGFIAYTLMLVIAIVIGVVILRPYYSSMPGHAFQIHPAFITLISVFVGVLITATFIELGHVLGAKMGKYEIISFVILGLGFKKDAKGKKKLFAGSYDGLMGETKIVPKDANKSNPTHYTWMPLLMLILEIICFGVLAVFYFVPESGRDVASASTAWIYPASISCLAVVAMTIVYDYFPARLDTANDGYITTIITTKQNKEAYNQLLIAQKAMAFNLPVDNMPVYDEVTDFTASINNITLYDKLAKKDYEGALEIVEKTLANKKKVSSHVYNIAECQKVAIICMTRTKEEAQQYYLELDSNVKKYIATLSNIQAVRAYVLINGLIQDSLSETKAGLAAVNKAVRKCQDSEKNVEKLLIIDALNKVKASHPDWDFSDFEISTKKDSKK